MRKAVIEEQNKNSCLRESQRILDTSLRRTEQENDSLGFRNKQLEHRVAALQEDLDRESKKPTRNAKSKTNSKNTNDPAAITDPVFTEELQKKIIENAQLVSLVADKNAEIQLLEERMNELEQRMARKHLEQTDSEKRLRRDLDALVVKNGLLEQRLTIDGSSISDDTISVADSDHITPMHQSNNNSLTAATLQHSMASNAVTVMNAFNVEKVARLEKEVFQLRTKLDFLRVCDTSDDGEGTSTKKDDVQILCNGASAVSPCTAVASIDSLDGETGLVSKDQLMFNHFTAKLDKLFTEQVKAESQVVTLVIEVKQIFCFYIVIISYLFVFWIV